MIFLQNVGDFLSTPFSARTPFSVGRWLLISAILTLTASFAFPQILSANPVPHIMVYGDSLSAAYGIDPKDGWVSLLREKMRHEGVIVTNSSISGETTRGGVNRIKADLDRFKPNVVVIVLGANDGLRGLPVEETKKNLQSIINAARAAHAKVVLIGIQIPPNYGIEFTRQFRELYFDLAKSNRLPPPPFLLEGIAENLKWFQQDRLHPTAAAQPAILVNVFPVIQKVLALRATKVSAR